MSRLRPGKLRGSVTQNSPYQQRRTKSKQSFGLLARLMIVLVPLGLIIGFTIWLWHTDWPDRQAKYIETHFIKSTESIGFTVADVIVEGRKQTDRNDLASALNISIGDPILNFNPDTALDRISKLPWIADATVVRKLPNTIYVRLVEREPIARWQHNGKIVVIDREGKELPNASLDKFASLPLVIGDDAPQETGALLKALKDFPAIANLLQAATRVSDRRWNLHMQPKILVKLPEYNIGGALQRLSQMIRERKILERGMVTVDLRIPDRLFLENGNAPQQKK